MTPFHLRKRFCKIFPGARPYLLPFVHAQQVDETDRSTSADIDPSASSSRSSLKHFVNISHFSSGVVGTTVSTGSSSSYDNDAPQHPDAPTVLRKAAEAIIDFKRMFAVIIGIDRYRHGEQGLLELSGAIADADAVNSFLLGRGVPPENVEILHNEQATADEIKRKILALASNHEIRRGDPILIYYAGYGSNTVIPEAWADYGMPKTAKVQLLLPYDFSIFSTPQEPSKGQGLLDRTLSALLRKVADAKGDNIVVVLDCCHSGSATRDDSVDKYRGVNLPSSYRIYDHLDSEYGIHVNDSAGVRDGTIPEDSLNTNMRSHVLLAACSEYEQAGEKNGRGNFTKKLLEFLDNDGLISTTYMDTLLNLPNLPNYPKQIPRCEGVNRGRLIFRSVTPACLTAYPVRIDSISGFLSIEAGEASGILPSMEFTIHDSPASVKSIATTKVWGLKAYHTQLKIVSTIKINDLPNECYARRGRREPSLRIFVEEGTRSLLELEPNGQSALEPLFDALFVEDGENYDIALVGQKGQPVGFRFRDDIYKYGLEETRFTASASTADDIRRVLEAACCFYTHLRSRHGPGRLLAKHTPSQNTQNLASKFKVECHRVVEELGDKFDILYAPADKKNDFYNEEDMTIRVPANGLDLNGNPVLYGVTVHNFTNFALFAWVFFFNSRAMSINLWHQPTNDSVRCLGNKPTENRLIEIGYGACSGGLLAFTLREGESLDVGFIKIIVSTKYVDLSTVAQVSSLDQSDAWRNGPTKAAKDPTVAQVSPFDKSDASRYGSTYATTLDFWASRCIPVIQTGAKV